MHRASISGVATGGHGEKLPKIGKRGKLIGKKEENREKGKVGKVLSICPS